MTATDATIRVDIDTLDELFSPPVPNPLAGRFETTSGIEQIEQQAKLLPRPHLAHGRIVVALPQRPEQPDIDARLAAAVAGYSRERIADIEKELEQSVHEGRQALWLGLGFLACCLLLSSAAATMTFLPPLIQRLFSEGFIIAGWVALWRPIELLLYDAWPFRRDLRVLRAMAGMPVTIVAR